MSVAIWAQAISCSNVRGVYPVHERFWFCLVQVSTTQSCSFSFFLMARASDGTDVPVSPVPASSSNVGSPNSSLPDLDATGFRVSTMVEKINEMFVPIAKWLPLIQSVSRFENCVQTLSQTAASYDAKITNIEQIVCSLAARLTAWETNATSVSSGSGSARSWNILGHGEGSTATGSLGSHGPGSSANNRNTRRRLDTFSSPEDEQSRSAVLLQFSFEQYHKGVTKWITSLWEDSNMPAYNKPFRIHCKAGSVMARLVFETRAKCQDVVARYQEDGIPYEIDSPFCCARTTITVRQSKSIEDREIGINLHPCGECWQISSKFSTLMKMTKLHLSSQRSTPAHRSSALKIEETVLENLCSNLRFFFGSGQMFTLAAPDLYFPGVSREVLQRIISMCDGRPFSSPLFRRLAGRGVFFRGFPFRWVLHFVLSSTRSVIIHDATSCSKEDSLDECQRTCDTMSCLFFIACGSPEPIHIGAGDSVGKGYRPDLFQDVPDQSRHMLTNRAHVLGLACGSVCKI